LNLALRGKLSIQGFIQDISYGGCLAGFTPFVRACVRACVGAYEHIKKYLFKIMTKIHFKIFFTLSDAD